MNNSFFKCTVLSGAALLLQLCLQAQWSYVGNNVSTYHTYPGNYNMCADTAGVPYVAFADLGNTYVVTVKKLQDDVWTNVGTPGFITGSGSASGLFYNPGIAIAVNPVDNQPWVALADGDNGNRLSVMRFDGTAWVLAGSAGFTTTSACNARLVFTSDGTPYVAYISCYDGATISVMRYMNGIWSYAGASDFATGNYMQLAVAPNDRLAVVFQDQAQDYQLSVKQLIGGNWQYAGAAGFSDGAVESMNITADANSDFYVCYTDDANNYRVTVKKLTGSNWTTVGDPSFTNPMSRNVDISVNRFGIPYVSYVDGYFPVVKKYSNGEWLNVGNYVATAPSYHTSIFNDSLGNPWVFTSLESSATYPFVLKYKPCSDADYHFIATAMQDSAISQTGGTTTVTVSATGGVGPYTGTGTFTVPAGYYIYTVTDANGCAVSAAINVGEPQPVCADNYWTGSVSTAWDEPGNWSCGSVPGNITTVYIEPGATRYPVLQGSFTCRQLIASPGTVVTIAAGATLNITGE